MNSGLNLVILLLLVSFFSIEANDCVDTPMVNHFDAPLKASFDISILVKEMRTLVKGEAKNEIEGVITERVEEIVQKKFAETTEMLESKFQNLTAQLKKTVAMVACMKRGTTFTASKEGVTLQISEIRTIYGITPASQFVNGEFVCRDPGLYMIFGAITSNTKSSTYYIYRNNTEISGTILSIEGGWVSGTAIAFAELDINDRISIVAGNAMLIGDRSCFGLAKIG